MTHSPYKRTALPAQGGPRLGAPAFLSPTVDFKSFFDRRAFAFSHALSAHPLFSMECLVQAARRLEQRGKISYHGGDASPQGGWDGLARRPKRVESVFEALEQIRTSGAWIKIQHTQELPEYAQFVESLLDEMSELSARPLKEEITRISSTIFISSPGAVTPYHMDHETNFLFQIRGAKTYHLFDADDPSVVSAAEIERFLVYGEARCRDGAQPIIHELRAGRGVHQPSCWPHWAKTGGEPSVSLSVNFCLRGRDLQARVHQYNYYLRRLGLRPVPPGRSRIRDGLKEFFFASVGGRRSAQTVNEHLRAHLRRVEAPLDVLRQLKRAVKGRGGEERIR